jgi:hypothetical protein
VDNFVDKGDMALRESLLLIKTDHRQPKVKQNFMNRINHLQKRSQWRLIPGGHSRFVHNSAVANGASRVDTLSHGPADHAPQHEVNVIPHLLR